MKTPTLSKTNLLVGALGLCLAGSAVAGTLQEGLVIHLPFDGSIADTTGNVIPTLAGGANTEAAGRLGAGP